MICRPAQASDIVAIKSLIQAVKINPVGLKWQHLSVAVAANDTLIGRGQIKPHRLPHIFSKEPKISNTILT